MDDMTLFSLIFFGVWALVGLVFLIVSLILRRVRIRRIERCTMSAPGVIVDMRYRSSQKGGSYHPVVEFHVQGRPVHVESAIGSRPSRFVQGERVLVHFDPERPARFYIDGDNTVVILERVFLFVGLGCILIGSLVAYFAQRLT